MDLLYFNRPAGNFLEAVPLGNGHNGALVFGETDRERIALNDISLWSGWPVDLCNPDAAEGVRTFRDLFFRGKYAEAEKAAAASVCRKGKETGESADGFFGTYQTLGDLALFHDTPCAPHFTEYERMLDMRHGICTIRHRQLESPGNLLTREYFISRPDDVFSFRMTASEPHTVNMVVRLRREKEGETAVLPGNFLLLQGSLSGGMRYAACAKVIVSDGTAERTSSAIRIRNASEVRILLTSATSFTCDSPADVAMLHLSRAVEKHYDDLKKRHSDDVSALYGRMELRIGTEPDAPVLFSSLFRDLAEGRNPGRFASLFARYNRYLLISCSRPGNLPANIQGIWSDEYRPAWASDYHLNGNTQMVYWPAEAANLPECHLPLLDWMRDLAKAGARTAKHHFGVRGWTANWVTTPWLYTEPGQNLQWGLFPEAGAWLALHIRDHFEFTGDMQFLRDSFPILRGACEFCLDMLARDPASGKLLFGPTVPPEHGYITENGETIHIAYGTSAGQEIVYALFSFTLSAAERLGDGSGFRSELKAAMAELALPGIDSEGMIAKWIFPFRGDGARHFRHAFGLYPGGRISPEKTPELVGAMRKTCLDHEENSLDCEGEDRAKGSWSGVWLLHSWARLRDAEKAYDILRKLLLKTTSPNLFTRNVMFYQADGNMGSLSGILEMLVQSESDGTIRLLPALPDAWKKEGSLSGVRARGGFEVSFDWKDGTAENIRIHSLNGGTCRILANGREIRRETQPGQTVLAEP